MHDVVISGTGLWVAPEVITNEELVASYNAYAQLYNAQHAAAIAAGELTALAESSAEFIEKASGIRQRYVVDKAGVLDRTRMRPHLTPRPDDALSLQAEIGVAAARDALAAAGRDAADVDMLLCATSNFQRPYPALGVEIQNGIGAGGYAFDMNVACSSAGRLAQVVPQTSEPSGAVSANDVVPFWSTDEPATTAGQVELPLCTSTCAPAGTRLA